MACGLTKAVYADTVNYDFGERRCLYGLGKHDHACLLRIISDTILSFTFFASFCAAKVVFFFLLGFNSGLLSTISSMSETGPVGMLGFVG